MENKKNINLKIFEKKINNKYKLLPFNKVHNNVGPTKYLPPISKEWKNTVYTFNPNNIKNYPIYDKDINNLINDYFNLRFDHKFIFDKYRPEWKKRITMNKIYLSKAEIKHTNSNAIISIFTFNKEKSSLLQKIKFLRKSLKDSLKTNFKFIYMLTHNANLLNLLTNLNFFIKDSKLLSIFLLKKFNKNKLLFNNNLSSKIKIKILFYYYILILRKYKLKLNLNKYKFEERFLYKLSYLISKFYNKKVTFNIINLKSFVFHSDFFTKILGLKLKNRKIQIMKWILYILNKASLPRVNRLKEIGKKKRTVDYNLLENKYPNINLFSLVKENNFINILNDSYFNSIFNLKSKNNIGLYDIIFNSIKFKNMAGIRLEVGGRLTKRYRADRALFKVKWKGGLKNIDSSYKGLSSVNIRGYINPNVDYSILASKRRIGSFAVKGWLSGK
jgi:hypothetical protein